MSAPHLLDPAALSPTDREALHRLRDHLAALARAEADGDVLIRLSDGEEVALPLPVARALAAALTNVADGQVVRLAPAAPADLDKELSTTEAAALLGVSRPYLVRLLNERRIPCRKVGTHRRIRRGDALTYKRSMEREGDAAFEALVAQGQALGMGY